MARVLPPRIVVPKELVLRIFNHTYLPLVIGGQLRSEEVYRKTPDPKSGQPPGALSIVEHYWDTTRNVKVACAHYFWLPPHAASNGWRIGGKARVPDAKMVYWDGVLLIAES
jgi:hypothetical protein